MRKIINFAIERPHRLGAAILFKNKAEASTQWIAGGQTYYIRRLSRRFILDDSKLRNFNNIV